MSEEIEVMLDIGTLFHNLLFAYEKAVKEILGSGKAVFVHPTLEVLKKIDEKKGSRLMEGKNLDEAWNNLSNFFLRGNVVKEFSFKKIDLKNMSFALTDACGRGTSTKNSTPRT